MRSDGQRNIGNDASFCARKVHGTTRVGSNKRYRYGFDITDLGISVEMKSLMKRYTGMTRFEWNLLKQNWINHETPSGSRC